MMDATTKKTTGSFYTCNTIADFIADWAVKTPEMCVLEPAFGDGIFIDSALVKYEKLGNHNPKILGVEIQKNPYNLFMQSHKEVVGFNMDFIDFKASTHIDAIIGNPPYISLKRLDDDQRKKTLQLISDYGINMQTSGSLWMPFVIHSTELLEQNGKLGFVLPYEITYVRYASELWKYLASNYGKLTICRIYHDFFPDVDVETIVILAEKKGLSTKTVNYRVFKTIEDLFLDNTCIDSQILIEEILSQNKPFERELLPKSVTSILKNLKRNTKIDSFVRDCKFKIGYVSGNKKYFHLSEDEIKKHNILRINTRKCLLNAKQIDSNPNIGVETKPISNYNFLFYPIEVANGEKEYISYGESQGVNKGYKCKVRKPWYLTPGLEIPDIVLTVFGDVPRMLLNDGRFYVSNSLLSGFSKLENAKELICRWYNSLTLLSVEITIHSLGGGTLVLIPGETDKLEIITDFPVDKIESTYKRIADFACNHSTSDVYQFGDTVVLKEIYGFSDESIREIRNSICILRNWRNPEKRRG